MSIHASTTVRYEDPEALVRRDARVGRARLLVALGAVVTVVALLALEGVIPFLGSTLAHAAVAGAACATFTYGFYALIASGDKPGLDRGVAESAAKALSEALGETVPYLRVYAALGHLSNGYVGSAVLAASSQWETTSGLYEVLADHPVAPGTDSVTFTVTRLRGPIGAVDVA